MFLKIISTLTIEIVVKVKATVNVYAFIHTYMIIVYDHILCTAYISLVALTINRVYLDAAY